MIPLHLDRSDASTLQEQIYEQVRAAILADTLRPGTPLPSSRELARELKVSRNTVVLAFERLAKEGYLAMRPGAGTFVCDMLPESCLGLACLDRPGGARTPSAPPSDEAPKPAGPAVVHPPVLLRAGALRMVQTGPTRLQVDFWYGSANSRNFPLREWRQLLLENLSRASGNLSGYGPPEGAIELRSAIATHVSANRAIPADPDQVIITAGAQEGFNLVSRLFVQPGVKIAVEDPCYAGAALVFSSYGGTLVPVPVDLGGLCTELLAGCGATLAYVTPSHQFPTGTTMSAGRRRELLSWAQRSGAYIIEDDYDSDFRYDGPPLAALAGLNGNTSVIYLGTFSKSIGAGLRIGYAVVPKQLVGPIRHAKSIASYGHPWIDQIVLADFIAQGRFARHVRRIRQTYSEARQTLVESLTEHFGTARISGAEAGMHVMWTLPDHFPSVQEVAQLAAEEGVGVYTLEAAGAHEIGPSRYPRALVLGYAALTPEAIRTGIARIARTLKRAGVDLTPRYGRVRRSSLLSHGGAP
ncbi:PLP-dependent aminotransferase family protein [Xanthobacter dioxanivorans]|uniref:PLP-dependent aminotransferase family protein n=1 Tax=Xanthobacter dioxanivorans TaxID=2528964 RepID=A0A974PLD8_9HYPH|nr:PLP-dependent aminotransferase family protein [Xanthobacter dioxanivorans]QRG05745.1 PLP-dependent aminotransferase family protein [Xanthobacter dioxanivorans]